MVPDSSKGSKEQQPENIATQITAALQGIRFGSVEIIIHDGKVVQIERKEKLRFDIKSVPEK